MTWNSKHYLEKLNSLYRSSENGGKSETLFKKFFESGHFFAKVEYEDIFEEKNRIENTENFKKTEFGLEYVKNDASFSNDEYIEMDGEYFVPISNFKKVLKTFLEDFPLLDILNENISTYMAGGLFARLFVKYFHNFKPFVYNDLLDTFKESDLDIYVSRENSEAFLKSMAIKGKKSFHILDVNCPTGYNTFLQRNKIAYRVRCCIDLKNKKMPLDIMVTDEEPSVVIRRFDLTASQWGFDGKTLSYFASKEKEKDFFKRICHINDGYVHDVLSGNPITLKRLYKYSVMSFLMKTDISIHTIEKVALDTDEFPNLHWIKKIRFSSRSGTLISKEQQKQIEEVTIDGVTLLYSSSLRNITQTDYYSFYSYDDVVESYYPVNFERICYNSLRLYGFSILKKWTFVKLFISTTFHKQYIKEDFDETKDGMEKINRYWLEMIFGTNGTRLNEWNVDSENPAWFGVINFLRQYLNKRSFGPDLVRIKEATKYKESLKKREDLGLLFSNYNSLSAIYSSMFQSTDQTRLDRITVSSLYGSIKFLKKYFHPVEHMSTNKDYIRETLELWNVNGQNIVSLEGLKWIDQPFNPENNFFFVQLSWWSRSAMKERVLYCYNNFMNINKLYPWFGSSAYYKSLFVIPTEQLWKPSVEFLRNNLNYYVMKVTVENNHFVVQPESNQFIINTFVDLYKDEIFSGNTASSNTLTVLKDLILRKRFFKSEDFLYEYIMASIDDDEDEIQLYVDVIYIPEKQVLSDSLFKFSKKTYDTVFDIMFEDPLMFTETTVEKYLREDFRSFVIIVKGPNYNDLIPTSWIDKLPNGMDDYNKISNCYFKTNPNSKPHTIYRRMGNNRTLIAEDYLSRCAFSRPKLENKESGESIGAYTHWKKACDVYGKSYVPRGRDISSYLNTEQMILINEKIVSENKKIIKDTYLEKMSVNIYDYFVMTNESNEVSFWIPITEKMSNDDYSEQLLDYRDRIMLVDVEEINNGSSPVVTIGNPDFWCVDYPYNIFGYQGDIHTHLGASQHVDLERFSVRAEVNDSEQWDFDVVNYFEKYTSISWDEIFYDKKEQIFGTPQRTMTVGNIPRTPDEIRTPSVSGGRRLSYSLEGGSPGQDIRTPIQNRSPTLSEAATTVQESPDTLGESPIMPDFTAAEYSDENYISVLEEVTMDYLEELVDYYLSSHIPLDLQILAILNPSEDIDIQSERYITLSNRAFAHNLRIDIMEQGR